MLENPKMIFKKVYFRFMILVTGATGLVGAHLLLSLARKHNKLVALYRSKQKKYAVFVFFSKNDTHHPKLYNHVVWLKAELNLSLIHI